MEDHYYGLWSHGKGRSHTGQIICIQGMLLRSAHHGLPTVRTEHQFSAGKYGNTDDPQYFLRLRKY